MCRSCAHKLLRVNLESRKISLVQLNDDIYESLLGGVGFGIFLMKKEMTTGTSPLSRENKLLFLSGPLNGTRVPFASKLLVCSISPLTERFLYSSLGGGLAFEMKFAGYDGVIIEGRAEKPCYLLIDDDFRKIVAAEHLWGKTTSDTLNLIKEEQGNDELQIACIGPAGEKYVRFANIVSDHDSENRGGFGAIMGYKNLKAIAIKGSKGVEVYDIERLREKIVELNSTIKNTLSRRADFAKYGTAALAMKANVIGSLGTKNWLENSFNQMSTMLQSFRRGQTKSYACYGCPISCKKYVRSSEGIGAIVGLESIFGFGSMCNNGDLESIIQAKHLCDDLGLDAVSTGVTISFAMECAEKNAISFGLKSKDGNCWSSQAIVNLVRKIANRQEEGAVLAEGTKRAAEQLGGTAKSCAMNIRGLEVSGTFLRALPTAILTNAIREKGIEDFSLIFSCDEVQTDKNMEICEEGKMVDLLTSILNSSLIRNSLVVCPFFDVFSPVLSQLMVDILYSVTGRPRSLENLEGIGWRISKLIAQFDTSMTSISPIEKLPVRLTSDVGVNTRAHLDRVLRSTYEKFAAR